MLARQITERLVDARARDLGTENLVRVPFAPRAIRLIGSTQEKRTEEPPGIKIEQLTCRSRTAGACAHDG